MKILILLSALIVGCSPAASVNRYEVLDSKSNFGAREIYRFDKQTGEIERID